MSTVIPPSSYNTDRVRNGKLLPILTASCTFINEEKSNENITLSCCLAFFRCEFGIHFAYSFIQSFYHSWIEFLKSQKFNRKYIIRKVGEKESQVNCT